MRARSFSVVSNCRRFFVGLDEQRGRIAPAYSGGGRRSRAGPARRSRPPRRVAKNFSGSPIPAKASTLRAGERRDGCGVRLEARVEQRQIALRRAAITERRGAGDVADDQDRVARDRAAVRAARAAGRPGARGHCRCRACRRSRELKGPSRATDSGNPSSITMTLAPLSTARLAPATRFAATMVGATRASSGGSSPTCTAVCAGSTITGPASLPP